MTTTSNRRQGRSNSSSRSHRNYSSTTNRSHGRKSFGGKKTSSRGGFRSNSRRQSTRRKNPTFNPEQFINKNPVEAKQETFTPQHTFETFGLEPELIRAIHSLNITTPTPIQDQIIPEILNGKDVIGVAETGTGKTAAFLVPVIQKTLQDANRQTLILAPTRELAIQINNELRRLARGMRIYSTVCVGGMSIRPQIKNLSRTNHFIIGTPGRVMDLMDRGHFKPQHITTVVLDEADRMLDMGFIHDMRKVISATPHGRELLFFSATMSTAAKKLAGEFLNNPVTISVKKKDVTNSIEQDIVPHGKDNKFVTLTGLLAQPEFKRVIVFGAMKHQVEKLSKDLSRENISATSLHGNKNHGQRKRALDSFKSSQARVLVATDVAARGIHVDDVTHVINYDLPNTFEDYVHRIGRTGRGDQKGKALTFVPQTHRTRA